jgi:hypothetical protein
LPCACIDHVKLTANLDIVSGAIADNVVAVAEVVCFTASTTVTLGT